VIVNVVGYANAGLLFENDFEGGDTSAWSAVN
jgi:hypothetical protein